jgi:hypothetical protein
MIGYQAARLKRMNAFGTSFETGGGRCQSRGRRDTHVPPTDSKQWSNAELCCVLGFAGKPALPALLGRGVNLAGPSGYWVGHSSGSFAVGLLSDREPGLVPGSRGYT